MRSAICLGSKFIASTSSTADKYWFCYAPDYISMLCMAVLKSISVEADSSF
jgi:hypothetical protein